MTPATLSERIGETWRQFWFAEIPPHSYALLRILIGAVGVMTVIGAWNPAFWELDGLVPIVSSGLRPWLLSHGLGSVSGLGLRWLLLGGYTWLALGIRADLAAPAMFLGSAAMFWWNSLPYSAAQELMHHLPVCLLFVDSGRVWSIDAYLARRRGRPLAPRPEPIWPLRLLQYQVVILYFSAGLWKMGNPDWRSGLALHYIFNNPVYQRIPGTIPAALFPLTVGLTYLTLAWELLFPFLIWFRLTRPLMLAIGIALHLGMWSTIEVGAFSPTTLVGYVAFLDPMKTESRVRWLKDRVR